MAIIFPQEHQPNFETFPAVNTERSLAFAVNPDEGLLETAPLNPVDMLSETLAPVIDISRVRSDIATIHESAATTLFDDISALTQDTATITPLPSETSVSWLDRKVDLSKAKPRAAQLEDIEGLVDIDMKAFKNVYATYDQDPATLREELIRKFTGRFEKVGGDWIQVLEAEGKMLGFMTCCPTSKSPDDFQSWEDTTDNGTLETTYDPNGEYIYVVSLSMLPEASKINGHDILLTNCIGKFMAEGYSTAFFESRLPNLKRWIKGICRENGTKFDNLSEEDIFSLANEYYTSTKVIDGETVPLDPLLRVYDKVGCKFTNLVPDAYKDEQSLNFGVVCLYENPLPKFVQNNRLLRKIAGNAVRLATKNQRLFKLLP